MRPESKVCALLTDVANQEPLDYPGAPVDLSEAVLHMLLVGFNVARPDLLQVLVRPQQVVDPVKLQPRVTLPRLGVVLGLLVLPDVKGVLR